MDKLQKLKQLMDIANDGISRTDFVKAFENVLSFVVKSEKKTSEAVENLQTLYNEIIKKTEDTTEQEMEEMKKMAMDYCMNEMEAMAKEHDEMMKKCEGRMGEIKDGKQGEAGKDADEEEICKKVSESLVEPITERVSQNLASLGLPIRDSLELLQGDDRLVIEAIKGLREELDELRELRSRTVGGGGFSYMAMDQHIFENQLLVGTIDGVNTVFSLPTTPSPISSLKIYRGGSRQKIDVDFTLNGINVTFFVPPVVGEEMLCDLRH